ncbi:hypothetical protein EX30DRAFT_34757 [Ascodesmis nigricans]|uniref:Uncharacterized protein n=1 Tax=Ascodesmis nigricans TaxID=341454 RepID=A0A4S2MWN5_9PEZI|nr:hypothetical protein EX30DRAFT_34757 [Ascodesmis nigricans]
MRYQAEQSRLVDALPETQQKAKHENEQLAAENRRPVIKLRRVTDQLQEEQFTAKQQAENFKELQSAYKTAENPFLSRRTFIFAVLAWRQRFVFAILQQLDPCLLFLVHFHSWGAGTWIHNGIG